MGKEDNNDGSNNNSNDNDKEVSGRGANWCGGNSDEHNHDDLA